MRLFSIEGNRQRLDGGAMFGNYPKAIWAKLAPPDELNRIPLACRALLVREASAANGTRGRNVLLESGVGAFFAPKLKARYGVEQDRHVLLDSLAAIGLGPADIDVIVLSHLHFDHAGGLLTAWRPDAPLELAFPKACYVVSEPAWARAKSPHSRDRGSFIPELQDLLEKEEAAGRVEVVRNEPLEQAASEVLGHAYSFTFSEGHTPGLMLTRVEGWSEGPVTFLADLVPGAAWIHLPITMGYDRNPELLVDEKENVLSRIADQREWVFFTHDPAIAASRIGRDADGKYRPEDERRALP